MQKKLTISIIIILGLILITQSIILFKVCKKAPDIPEEEIEETVVKPGFVRGKVLTDNGSMVGAGIVVEDEKGNTYRAMTNPQSGYELALLPGTYNLYFTRGTEYSIVKKTVTVESFKIYYLQDVRLVQLFDSYQEGWIAGDLHQHTYYSDGSNSIDEVLLSNVTNGLYFGFLSDHNSAMGLSEWVQGHMVANIDNNGNKRMFSPFEAVEETTEFGHYQSLGVGMTFDQYELILRDYERVKPKTEKDEIIKDRIIYIAEEIKRAGGVAQINHPYSSSSMGFNYWEVANHFDTIELWNGVYVPGDGRYETPTSVSKTQNYQTKLKWFELLNEVKNGGKYFPATGGTDNHDVASPYLYNGDIVVNNIDDYQALYTKSGKYSGQPTNYVKIDGEVTQEKILEGLKNGHNFISDGPIIIADINGATYGDTISLADATSMNLKAFCRDGLNQIKIIRNGEIYQTIDLDVMNYTASVTLAGLSQGDWLVIEVLGADVNYALTNPIFIG